jgi:hypothetical protein
MKKAPLFPVELRLIDYGENRVVVDLIDREDCESFIYLLSKGVTVNLEVSPPMTVELEPPCQSG